MMEQMTACLNLELGPVWATSLFPSPLDGEGRGGV